MLCVGRQRCLILRKSILETLIKSAQVALQSTRAADDVKVVVVGAGLAGLSAANHLHQNGFKNTHIIEATERCGGRINTAKFGDGLCELGAKWVPIDASKNSTYELLCQTQHLEKLIQQPPQESYVNLCKGQKVQRSMHEFIYMLFKRICTSLELRKKLECGQVQDLNSVHDYFKAETTQLVETLFPCTEQNIAKEVFGSLFKDFSSAIGCCLEYLNIEHLNNTSLLLTSPLYVPAGLIHVLQELKSGINDDNIKVGKPVGTIKWYTGTLTGRPTEVICMDGCIYDADHIICTLPLGVLKQFSDFMFEPALPTHKLRAIKKLGFGNPVKLFLEYNNSVENWFLENVRPIWTDEMRQQDNLRWPQQIVAINNMPSSGRVLEVQIGGSYYAEFEKIPDNEIIEKVTDILRRCFKTTEIPYPTSLLRSGWSSSACYLGGRPYISTESSANDVKTLSEPVGIGAPLLFAGDATDVNSFGTVDAARRSGIREAERIIAKYRYGGNRK